MRISRSILYIVCLFACAFAHADDTVYLPESSSAEAGGTVSLAVHLQSNNPACGYQFDVVLPEGVSVATDAGGKADIALSGMASANDYVLDCANMSDGSVRFLCYSNSNSPFSAKSGDVATIKLKVDSKCAGGTKEIAMRDVVISTSEGVATYVASVPNAVLKVAVPKGVLGDVNGDGAVDVMDALMIINVYLNNKTDTIPLSVGDVNKDGEIDTMDAIQIIHNYLNGQ